MIQFEVSFNFYIYSSTKNLYLLGKPMNSNLYRLLYTDITQSCYLPHVFGSRLHPHHHLPLDLEFL